MSKEEIDRYKSRCDLNIEVAILLDNLRFYRNDEDKSSKRTFYLLANTYEKDDYNEF